jgi:peptidoglycan/LPS O-acetylase OafA/YrhL
MIPVRFWSVVFALLTIDFLIGIYFVVKKRQRKRMGWCEVISYLFLPALIFLMLTNEQMTPKEKVVSSTIAFVCVISAVAHAYVLRKHLSGKKRDP